MQNLEFVFQRKSDFFAITDLNWSGVKTYESEYSVVVTP